MKVNLALFCLFDLNRGKGDTVQTLWTVHIQNVALRQTGYLLNRFSLWQDRSVYCCVFALMLQSRKSSFAIATKTSRQITHFVDMKEGLV